jgi:porphobilinogen deaminase
VIKLGLPDDKLQQALTRHLLHTCGLHTQVSIRLFHDDDDLREILATTGVPFFDPAFEALQKGEIDAVPVPGRFAPLYLPDGLAIAGAFFQHDPWVLVTQAGDEVLSQPGGAFTVGGFSKVALEAWKLEHPGHTIKLVQTDVHTRLQECSVGSWDAGIFLKSELDVLSFEQHYDVVLDHLPSEIFQGITLLVTREKETVAFPFDAAALAIAQAQLVFLRHLGAKPTARVSFNTETTAAGYEVTAMVFPPSKPAILVERSAGTLAEAARLAASALLQQGAGEWVSGPHAED